jgi:hypothetical protein
MSQFPNPYPSPYPPANFPMNYAAPHAAWGDPLRPAKRAALIMFILGGLGLLCGVCLGIVAVVPIQQMAAQQGQALPPLPPGVTWDLMQQTMGVFAVVAVIGSVLQMVVAFFVRRGGAAATAVGLVLTILWLLVWAAIIVMAVLSRQGMTNVVANLIPGSAFLLQLLLCIQAQRASAQVAQWQAAYQAQYWQYLQQQQAYQMGAGPGGAYNPASQGPQQQNPYHAPPAASAQRSAEQTGWQWTAPPPPPPTSSDAAQNQGGADGQNPQ